MGCDLSFSRPGPSPSNFNPRTPCGVRPKAVKGATLMSQFQSTHPVWGATPQMLASLAGAGISIHAPRVGCDTNAIDVLKNKEEFQSTHPVWGATACRWLPGGGDQFQSTHPVWGATTSSRPGRSFWTISIHAPRVGCDRRLLGCLKDSALFQSTHPVWGATVLGDVAAGIPIISIHAPRVGCDMH